MLLFLAGLENLPHRRQRGVEASSELQSSVFHGRLREGSKTLPEGTSVFKG